MYLIFRGWIIAKWGIWRKLVLFPISIRMMDNSMLVEHWFDHFRLLCCLYVKLQFYFYKIMGHVLIFLSKCTHLERMVEFGHLQFSNAAKHTHTSGHAFGFDSIFNESFASGARSIVDKSWTFMLCEYSDIVFSYRESLLLFVPFSLRRCIDWMCQWTLEIHIESVSDHRERLNWTLIPS